MTTIAVHTLRCGMPLITEVNPAVRSASVCWLLPVGSAADPADREGLSTLLSELIFRGAGANDSRAQADALDALGLARGADVGGQFLRLTATMLGDRLEPALALLADIARAPRLDPDAVEPARALALQALAGLKDQPQERAGILLSQRHNPPPINRSGLGTEAGLRSATPDDLARQWSARARPVGSILAVAGAIDPVALARRLDALLDGWTGEAALVPAGPSLTRGTYLHEPDDSAQVQILLAHDAPREADPDSILERIVASVLSGGSSSRLFTEVRERRGLCYSVSASYSAEKDWGRVTGYVGTTPEKAQQSLDVLLAELARIATPAGAVTLEEFARAVVGYKSRLVFSGESTAARAGALASDWHRLGRARALSDLASRVEAVTLPEVNAYLRRRAPGATTIVTLGPSPLTPPSGIPSPTV